MFHSAVRVGLLASLFGLASVSARGQSNTVPGMDVKLFDLALLRAMGREGDFPNGVNGLSLAVTSCNVGSVNIPWFEPMDANHPFIASLVVREMNGRFEQISDRSFIKHGFFATNFDQCGICQYPGSGHYLGISCSDTYSTNNNGDNYYLGPADELDPWLGVWEPICSHFDRGEPPVAPPQDCDGKRSFTEQQSDNLGPVGHLIRVLDQDLNVANATFYFQSKYVIDGEAEVLRADNSGSRSFTASWNGSSWAIAVPSSGNPIVYGSVLQRWSGATLDSNTNGSDDGRVFVAVKVTGPNAGLYHYEYAIHNRDNARGIDTLRVPICAAARALNFGFRDIDQDAGNQWSVTRAADEITFTTATNPLSWNTIFNFWFDSDAAPVSDHVTLEAYASGTGLPFVTVNSSAPLELDNVYLGDGCGLPSAPLLYATGNPPKASLGNATFGLQITGNVAFSPSFLLVGGFAGTTPLTTSCTLYMAPIGITLIGAFIADATGKVTIPAPIPNDPSLEGITGNMQLADSVSGGALWNSFNLSNGLGVRIGNALPACP